MTIAKIRASENTWIVPNKTNGAVPITNNL